MTDREMYVAIVEGNITDELIEKAQAKLTNLDAKNATRKEAKAAEHAEVDATVLAVLTDEAQTAAQVVAALGEGFNTSKVSHACKRLEAAGKVVIGDAKGSNGRTVKSYALA